MKRYYIQCRVVFSMLFVFSLLLSPSLLAQSAGDGQSPLSLLFSPIQNSPNNFSSDAKQTRKFEGKKQAHNLAKKRNKRHRRMHLNGSMLQGVERFSINLFDDTIVEVLVKHVKQNKRGRTLWRGRIVSKTVYGVKQLARGNVTFVINEGSIMGSVRLDGDLYEIQHEANGIHLIKEIETSEFPSDHPVILSPDSLSIDPTTSQSQASAVPALADTEIKVLVLYTQAVAAQTSDIASLVDLAIDETNQSFLNSGLSQVLQISLTSAVEVDYTETTYSEMITSLSANSDGVLDEIHELRIQEEADIVVLLAAQNDYCGIGYLNAQYDRAFAVVNYTCATGNYSFAHELGHLAGARHNIENDSTLTPFAYGHGFQSPSQTIRTIMAYNCELANCPRVDYWSNPLVEFSSEYMGEFEVSNNARVWDETATRLATLHESYIPPNTDRELWFFNINDYVYTSPIVDENNNVYFAGRDATIYSLNSDMTVNWQQTVSQGITPSLVLENNTIYYRTSGAGDREYGALNAADGQPLWSHVVTGNGNSPAVAADGTSYATDGAWLKSFAATGEEIDSTLVTYTAYAAPVIAEDGTVYLALSNGGLRAFSADLSSLWTYQLPTSFGRTCMAIGLDGTIYVPTVDGVLYAVDNSGSLLWEYAFDTTNYDRCPAIDLQNNIIIGTSSGVVLAISPAGGLVWQSVALGSQITSTATIADNGDILIGSRNRINALSASGTLLWSSLLNLNNQSSVAIADNGVAYIGDAMFGDGGLRAFNLSGQKLADTAWPRRHGNAKGSSRFERPENHAPVVVIDAPSDGANFLYSDGPFVLQASASDYEDGDLSAMVGWSSDIDGAITSPASLSIGLHNITASVLDSSLVSGSDVVLVNVSGSQNQSPSIEINSPLNNAVISEDNNPLTFVVNANDAEDGDLTSSVILTSNIDGIIQSPAILSVGLHQITASVTDSDEATSNSIISLEVTAHINIEPQVNIVSPASGSSISEDNNPVTFVVNASDTEDGDLTSSVILTSSIDGIIQSSAILSVGQHQITATVTDSDGASSTSNIALEITAHINIAPQVNIISPVSGSSASEDDNPIAFVVNASDVEDGDLTSSVVLSSSIDGIIQSPAALSVGQHQITASVTDSDGASSTNNITLEITAHINIAPTVTINSPSNGYQHQEEDGAISFDVVASDTEDGDLTASLVLTSSIDGVLVSPVILSVGQHSIVASVTDRGGLSSEDTVLIDVIAGSIETSISIVENFDSLPGASKGWSYYSSNASYGRIALQNGELLMDVTESGNYNTNEAVFSIDLAGFGDVVLSFRQADYGDESHAMPNQFSGHSSSDGVAISMDGNLWYSALPSSALETSSTGQLYTINLDEVVNTIQQNYDASFAYTDTFQIKLQQYDNYSNPTDGRGWDDFTLTAERQFLSIASEINDVYIPGIDLGITGCGDITLSNVSGSQINWDAVTSASWLTLASSNGALSPNQTQVLNACWDTTGFAVGAKQNASITFTNVTHNIETVVALSVTVVDENSALPLFVDFDSALPNNSDGWSFYSSHSSYGRIDIFNGRMRMDVSNNGNYNLNEAVLTLDLSNQSNVVLEFFQRETSDENHNMPSAFSGHHNSDGVAISSDGIQWYTVVNTSALDVGSSGQTFTVNLDEEVARIQTAYDSGFGYTTTFFIKFQQYDNYGNSTDGREWDNISIFND